MPDNIVPGPYPDGCPPPVQIDCIQVTKVYDSCFQTETRDNLCFPLHDGCRNAPPGSTVSATITSVTCTTVSVTPILNSSGQPTGFATVVLLVTAELTITITAPSGTVVCTFTGEFSFFKTVTLCAPTGTTITCQTPSTAVSPGVIIGHEVCFIVQICMLIEAVATVNLLVPTFGFCVPAPCVVAPTPPFGCPPSPLYPAQCVFPIPTATPSSAEMPIGGPLV